MEALGSELLSSSLVSYFIYFSGSRYESWVMLLGSMGLGTMIGGFILLFYSTSKRKVNCHVCAFQSLNILSSDITGVLTNV